MADKTKRNHASVIKGDITLVGNITFDGNLILRGNITMDGTLHVRGDLIIEGNLNPDYNELRVDGDLKIAENGDFGDTGTIVVTGNFTDYNSNRWLKMGDLNPEMEICVKGDFTSLACVNVSCNLNVDGNVEIEKSLEVHYDFNAKHDVSIGGYLGLGGNTVVKGNISVGGDLCTTNDYEEGFEIEQSIEAGNLNVSGLFHKQYFALITK